MTALHEPVKIVKNNRDPDICLNKGKVPGIKVAHEITVKHENNRRDKTSRPGDGKAPHENIHEKASQDTVKQSGIPVSDLRGEEIIEDAGRVKHGGLDIGDERQPRKKIRIPERKGGVG